MISVFYLFSVLVLCFRICYYGACIKFYLEFEEHEKDFDRRDIRTHRYDDMVKTTRLIGSFFLTADYTKYALGFF